MNLGSCMQPGLLSTSGTGKCGRTNTQGEISPYPPHTCPPRIFGPTCIMARQRQPAAVASEPGTTPYRVVEVTGAVVVGLAPGAAAVVVVVVAGAGWLLTPL